MDTEPIPELDAEQQVVQNQLHGIVTDVARADGDYNQIPESRGGKIISADVARFLIPDFAKRDFRIRHTPSTAKPAGIYAHQRMLRDLRRGPPDLDGLATSLAGGAGSGKTTSLGGEGIAASALVFDNQMLDLSRARTIVESCVEHGWFTEVTFVYRPFELVVKGVIDRSVDTGRWNRIADLAAMHQQAQRTFWDLSRLYMDHPRVVFLALENLGIDRANAIVRPLEVSELAPGEPRRYSCVQSLQEIAHAQVEAAIREGRLTEPLRTLCGAGLALREGGGSA